MENVILKILEFRIKTYLLVLIKFVNKIRENIF